MNKIGTSLLFLSAVIFAQGPKLPIHEVIIKSEINIERDLIKKLEYLNRNDSTIFISNDSKFNIELMDANRAIWDTILNKAELRKREECIELCGCKYHDTKIFIIDSKLDTFKISYDCCDFKYYKIESKNVEYCLNLKNKKKLFNKEIEKIFKSINERIKCK